jgi:hypothetical protein
MSFNFHNQSTGICRTYSRQFWAKALELAQLYGWKPMGTCIPEPNPGWLGTYLTNDGQTVNTVDAFWLADALEDCLKDVSDTASKFDWNPKLWRGDDLPEWLSPEEKETVEECLHDGLLDVVTISPLEYFAGDEKRSLAQFIRFCRLGSFVIL